MVVHIQGHRASSTTHAFPGGVDSTLGCVSLALDPLDGVGREKNRAGHVYVSTAKAYTFGRVIEGPEGVRMITCRVDMKLAGSRSSGHLLRIHQTAHKA